MGGFSGKNPVPPDCIILRLELRAHSRKKENLKMRKSTNAASLDPQPKDYEDSSESPAKIGQITRKLQESLAGRLFLFSR